MTPRWRDPVINWRGGRRILPAHTHDALVRHIEAGEDPWDPFFDALLGNDLNGAVLSADDENLVALPHIVGWLYNYAPSECMGSIEKVREWRRGGGLVGMGLLGAREPERAPA